MDFSPGTDSPAMAEERELPAYAAELKGQNDALRTALNHSRNAFLIVEPDGRFSFANRQAEALLGYDAEELSLMSVSDTLPADDQARGLAEFRRVLAGDRLLQDWSLVRKDGARINVEIYSVLLPSGKVLGELRDVTEIRRNAAELEQYRHDLERLVEERTAELGRNRSLLQALVDHTTAVVFVKDLEGRYLSINRRYSELFHVSNEEMRGRTDLDLFPPEAAEAMRAADREVLAVGAAREYEEVVPHDDGPHTYLSLKFPLYGDHGQAYAVCGIATDITERKRLEMELEARRAEMELLGHRHVAAQTAAAIAHELNQPLVSVSAYSEAALSMLAGGTKSPEKLAHALRGAVEQAHRAGRTLHELLDFLHKGDVVSEPVDLNVVLRQALASAAGSGSGEFRQVVELAGDLPPVLANRVQVEKVLVNLLRNGVDAMVAAGSPVSVVTVQSRQVEDMAQVMVQDSGPGLDPETARRVFEPFFTTKPRGMGLGLAISRALIEAHGGRLWLDLDSGQGARFFFTLPFAS
ncbi:MAG: PAS domain-containing protein [Rhodocyclaceae bacterium]|nr:PAS domain-containing protein [Rhodocyclaceae bacterium]